MIRSRLTKDKIKEIELLKGEIIYPEIAKLFNVHVSTINYHLNEKHRERVKARSRKRILKFPCNKKKRREYQRRYQKERYEKDLEFRERMKKFAREYKRKISMRGRKCPGK